MRHTGRLAVLALGLAGCRALFPFDTGEDGSDGGRLDSDVGDAGEPPIEGGPQQDGGPLDGSVDAEVPPGESDWLDLALGQDFTCGIRAPGDLLCWGFGASGRLLDPSGADRAAPNSVSLGGLVQEVEAGPNHACAIANVDELRVYCWGVSTRGQAGRESGVVDTPEWVELAGATGIPLQLALGNQHSCVRMDSGEVWCWGSDQRGQLGDPSTSASRVEPTRAEFDGVAQDLSAGDDHTCVLLEDATLRCWGNNSHGQVLLSDGGPFEHTPTVPADFPAISSTWSWGAT
ncbi:MAG: RCC1 domain-containing protein [Sandaracinaceae bacterium]